MKTSAAEILTEYGPFPGAENVDGVTFDGRHVWFASGDRLNAFDPESGKTVRSIDVAAHAGTAFDGKHLFQIAEDRIQKIDPKTGRVLVDDPGARWRRRLGARVGGRDALGGAAPRPEDPSDRSRDRSDPSHDRNPTASLPASPGSTASSGTAPGRATRATCGESIPIRARCWSASRCRRERAYRGSSPTAAIGSSAAADAAAR